MPITTTMARRPIARTAGLCGIRTRPAGHCSRPTSRWAPRAIEPGRTAEAATVLRRLDRSACLSGTFGPADTDHYFRFRVECESVLRLALLTPEGVAGVQLVRLADEADGGDSPEVEGPIASLVTLVTNPASMAPTLGPGWYLVRVYSFFRDEVDYALELSLRSPSRALVILPDRDRDRSSVATSTAAPCPVPIEAPETGLILSDVGVQVQFVSSTCRLGL